MLALCLLDEPPNKGTTLIVAPTEEVAKEWMDKIREFCENSITAFHYSADARKEGPLARLFKAHNFVVVNHATLRADFASLQTAQDPISPNRNRDVIFPLFETRWTRVTIDVGESIRNRETQIFKAMCKLTTKRKWAMVDTHYVNSLEDVGSLLIWIGVEPFAQFSGKWTALVNKIKAEDKEAMSIREEIYKEYILRRTEKTTDLDGLPLLAIDPPIEEEIRVTLTNEDQTLYAQILFESPLRLKPGQPISSDTIDQLMGRKDMRTVLIKLRELCCDRRLLVGIDSRATDNGGKSAKLLAFIKLVNERRRAFPNEKM